ncbi:MAG: thioredoxin family protein [Ignavibacteria bacterium]|nr:thioredoxin family protein [Ignavibacteria bacterium]
MTSFPRKRESRTPLNTVRVLGQCEVLDPCLRRGDIEGDVIPTYAGIQNTAKRGPGREASDGDFRNHKPDITVCMRTMAIATVLVKSIHTIWKEEPMMRRFVAVLSVGLLFISAMFADDTKRKVENFTLEDYTGARHSLTDYKSSKAIVLMFIATQCPVSNAYNERMAKLYEDYKSKGVAFIGINSNKQESVEEIKKHSKENNFGFPVLKDWKNVIADKLEASVTPEIYVLNSNFEVLYHGRIDDSQREARITSKDLREALDAILAGKAVEVTETKAFGCTIKRVK